MSTLNSVNTKLEAFKLIHDPVKLLSLLFSKYGDIEEDYNLLYIDQLVYNRSSHYNILFKEFKYYNMTEENLKRYYFEDECKQRLPKLSEYYKNYHMFFCKPTLKNFQFGEILHNNDDNKAEIFYKKNYCSNQTIETFNKKDTSLSSLDNLTNNKTIFDKKTIFFIEDTNNKDNITITLDNSKILNCNLLSKRSKDDSFQNYIREIVSYNSNKNKNPKTIKNKDKKDIIKYNKNIQKTRICKIKSSLYSIMKPQFNSGNRDNSNKNKTITPTEFKHYLSNLEEFNKNKIISKSNFSNFTKLSSVLSNTSNKNSIKNSKYSIKNQMKNKDSFYQTNKNNYNNISAGINTQYSLLIGNMLHSKKINNTIQKNKNKSQQKNENNNNIIYNVIFSKKKIKNNTFDSNQVYNSNYISKLNSNSNFSTFNVNSNYSSNKKLTKGSNFNLVKSPLTNILKGKTINPPSLLNDRKISTIVSQKSILRKGNFHISSSNSLTKYAKNNKNNKIFNHFDNSNIRNFVFSSQRSTSDTSNLNILQNNMNNSNKDTIKISRNKINNIISQTKSYKKNISNKLSSNHTKSVEEFNNRYRNGNTHRLLDKIHVHNRVNVEKKPFRNKNWNKTIEVSYSKNDTIRNNSKPILEKSIKPINVNLNKNLLLSAERKNKVNSKILSKQ